jgi:glycerophosphoryl diester phosphodiesterase
MREVIRTGVDGIITDLPDLLQQVLKEERAALPDDPKLKHFDVAAHRGGRGLRPENTLPSFESGLDQLSTTLETDTGVSTDHVSTIWHEQFYNPQSCRHADGTPYTMQNRVYLRDISSTDAQKTLSATSSTLAQTRRMTFRSPVAVAFAKKDHMPSPYAPTNVPQLFRFVKFYVHYYRRGAGRHSPHARERVENAARVRFNIETKILPENLPEPHPSSPEIRISAEMRRNHTIGPQLFVTTLAGTIMKYKMESRAEIQSFDFRTLILLKSSSRRSPPTTSRA